MKLPNQSVVTLMGSGYTWLFVVYTILLFCAFVSTSVTLVYSMIQRFEGHCFPKAIKSKAVRSVIVGLIVIGLCYAVSLLGLSMLNCGSSCPWPARCSRPGASSRTLQPSTCAM